jgi:hypothetical protein
LYLLGRRSTTLAIPPARAGLDNDIAIYAFRPAGLTGAQHLLVEMGSC